MASQSETHTYKQGHNRYSTATHERRTARSDAVFLVPHIKPTDRLLDVGCGPGTITTSFAQHAHQGAVIGIDVSTEVLQRAQALADQAQIPNSGPGSVIFKQGNVLERLPFDDDTFDVVFASQVLGHIPLPDLPVTALSEMRRVLKTGGLLATRDMVESHAYPRSLELDRLWNARQMLVLQGKTLDEDSVGTSMPTLYRRAGFDVDAGKVVVGASTAVVYARDERKWLAARMAGLLEKGSTFNQNWLKTGFTEHEIEESVGAIEKWANTEDAWHLTSQCEMLARK